VVSRSPLAILDRDGTIIAARDGGGGSTSAIDPSELQILPGAIEGMRALQDAGFVLAIATNQPGPAKGQATRAQVERTNAELIARLARAGVTIAAIEVCLHHPTGGPGGDASLVRACDCRKPAPGMLHALLARLAGDPARSWMIGDRDVDHAAGRAAGLRTALVAPVEGITPDVAGATLDEVAGQILRLPLATRT
jgi:D-glycero-D-manno-heptose 1,7-bisphosphate phosphatase